MLSLKDSRRHTAIDWLCLSGLLGTCLAGEARAAEQPTGDERFAIVSPEWLGKHGNDTDIRILDVRPDVHAYLAGHVPGAIHLADSSLRSPSGNLPVQFLSPEAMADLFRRANIGDGHQVVLYSDGDDVLGATMVAYCLHRLGHKRTAVLDGGYSAYAKTQKCTQAYPECQPDKPSPRLDRSVFVTLDEVRSAMNARGAVLVDARPAKVYAGEAHTWMRNGHVPGAVNLDWHHLMQADSAHHFKSPEEMRKLVEQAGLKKQDDVIVYCGTGREATLLYMVIKHVLGYPKVRLYEGSWTEYCSHSDLPVATGMQPGGAKGRLAAEK